MTQIQLLENFTGASKAAASLIKPYPTPRIHLFFLLFIFRTPGFGPLVLLTRYCPQFRQCIHLASPAVL